MDKRIGAQLYTVRDLCTNETDFEDTIKKLHDIGYKVVQISGIGNISAVNVREVCDKYGMVIACTHRGLDDYENNMDEIIDYHKTLGTKVAGLGSVAEDRRDTKEKMLEFIESLNRISEKLAENGITFAYHNHAHEFTKYDGKMMIDYMIENGNFEFIVDVYWVAYAGLNPAHLIAKMGKKCRIIHYKDLAMNTKNTSEYAEVGCGNLNWDEIITASENAEFALVEQDECKGNPIDSLKISYDFLVKKGFI